MTIQKIKSLVLQSYKKETLDEKKVKVISRLLTRKEFKLYLKMIKNKETKKTVNVITPLSLTQKEKSKLEHMFKNKKIKYAVEPNLGIGIKIIDNDTISDFSLKSELENLVSHLSI